jgi:cell division protein FtsQ
MRYFKSSKGKIKIAIAAAVILLGAVVFLSLQIKEIKVTGNKKYTQEQIVNLLFKGSWDRNAIFCIYKDRFQDHEQIPFVEDYKIVFLSPVKVEVIVYEKTVVGFVSYMGSYLYFDKDGIIVESSSSELPGVPRIVGLQYGHIALHQPLPVENGRIFSEILTLTQLLSTHELTVDEIKVFLGSNDQMNGKISELKDQLPVLKGLKGTLYLDTYDEAETVTSYRFVKNN